MHAVTSETILVDHSEDGKFLVKDFESGESRFLPDAKFHGSSFKYSCDFTSKFLRCFPGKTSIIFTLAAEEAYMKLIDANREGIFAD